MTAASGYSARPLAAKLGYGGRGPVWTLNMPEPVRAEIEAGGPVRWTARAAGAADAHLFVRRRGELDAALAEARATLPADAAIWVSWPKNASRVETELTEDGVRASALPLGLVDVKVCAVDATWSALKLVLRRAPRTGGTP